MAERPRPKSTLNAARAQAATRPLGSSLLTREDAEARTAERNAARAALAGRTTSGKLAAPAAPPKSAKAPHKPWKPPVPVKATTAAPAAKGSPASGPAAATSAARANGVSPARSRSTDAAPASDSPRVPVRPARAGSTRENSERRIVVGVVSVFVLCAVALASVNVVRTGRVTKSREALAARFVQVHEQQASFRIINGRFATWPELQRRGVRLAPTQTVRAWNADASHWFASIRDDSTGVICDRTGELLDEDSAERAPVCRSTR